MWRSLASALRSGSESTLSPHSSACRACFVSFVWPSVHQSSCQADCDPYAIFAFRLPPDRYGAKGPLVRDRLYASGPLRSRLARHALWARKVQGNCRQGCHLHASQSYTPASLVLCALVIVTTCGFDESCWVDDRSDTAKSGTYGIRHKLIQRTMRGRANGRMDSTKRKTGLIQRGVLPLAIAPLTRRLCISIIDADPGVRRLVNMVTSRRELRAHYVERFLVP